MIGTLIAAILLAAPSPAAGRQDSIAAARDLYTMAAYDETLAMLDRLGESAPVDEDQRAIEQYRAFCFIALGRMGDAERAIERLTRLDPAWELAESEAPPRIATIFAEIRTRALPGVVRERFTAARQLYGDERYAEAEAAFSSLVALLQRPSVAGVAGAVGEVAFVAAAFRDLAASAAERTRAAAAQPPAPAERQPAEGMSARAAEPPAAEPPAPDTPSTAPAAVSAAPAPAPEPSGAPIATPLEPVVPPTIITQRIPRPHDMAIPMGRSAVIVMDLLIDETGRVDRATVRQSVNGAYEAQLLSASRMWRYTPATQGGRPVKYVKTLEITLSPR